MSSSESFPRRVGPWIVRGSREIHRTPWLRVREDAIVWPDGKPAGWTVVEFPPAVGVVALTEDRQIHLVGQHRYAVDQFAWEIPEGIIDPGEDPIEAAKRELREETGLSAGKWTPLGSTHPHNGSCDCIYHLYLAEQLAHGQASPDSTELLSHKTMPFTQAVELAQSGELMDAFTVIGVFRVWHHLETRGQT